MSHLITRDVKNQEDIYSVRLRKQGTLYLSGIGVQAPAGTEVSARQRIENQARVQHMVKLLSTAPRLCTVGLPFTQFLRQKLPSVLFSGLTDSISVALGFRYDQLYANPNARRLWWLLFEETIDIIASLPELQQSPEIIDYFTGHNFRKETLRYLKAQTGVSRWIAMVRDGRKLPINYVNRYFIKRAEEAGVDCATHNMILTMVKAKQLAREEELKADIPLYRSPYMLDGDYIENDKETTSPVRIVYTNR
ncbi:hypothetical protein BX600DRAFT_512784 [Xylariales sp. PMI_506]|nr:hypothetical protein BX600DRAFT_512784 [Xylariales sp. PMI_506]